MILSLALISGVAFGFIPAWCLFFLLITFIPDIVLMELVAGK